MHVRGHFGLELGSVSKVLLDGSISLGFTHNASKLLYQAWVV